MLNTSGALNANQTQIYHAKEFTSAEQNYWKQGDTVPGEWQGRLAESFGLTGAVEAKHFARLSQGQHPINGDRLTSTGLRRNTQPVTDGGLAGGAPRRPGCTFSAPKSCR
jgi:hypothetical protein